jgi:hypothetical protein
MKRVLGEKCEAVDGEVIVVAEIGQGRYSGPGAEAAEEEGEARGGKRPGKGRGKAGTGCERPSDIIRESL